MKQNKMILLPAGVTVFLCTSIFLFCMTLLMVTYRVDVNSEEVWKIRVFLEDGISESLQEQVKENLEGVIGIQKKKWVSSADALKIFVERYGVEWVDNFEENPLPASWEVWPVKDLQSSYGLEQLAGALQVIRGVEEVVSSSESLRLIEGKKWEMVLGASVLVILLLFTLWLILRNSVRLSLFNRKVLVENMKYLGASTGFILFPFLFEAFVVSLLSVFFASLCWYPLFWGIQSLLPFFELSFPDIFLLQILVAAGVVCLSLYSTYRVIREFIWGTGDFL